MHISYVDYYSSRGGDQLKKIGRLKGMWGILISRVTQAKNIALIPIGWDLARGALTEQHLQQHAFA